MQKLLCAYFGIIKLTIILILSILLSPISTFAEEFIFETNTIRYVINSNGLNTGLHEKHTGKNWISGKPSPFANVTKSGKTHPVTGLRRDGDSLIAKFGETGITARYRILAHKTHITIELTSLKNAQPDNITLCTLQTTALPHTGAIIAAKWNDDITICLMALSDRVNSQVKGSCTLSSTVYSEFGMAGEKVALIAVPTSEFLDVVQEVEKTYHLPSPTIDGQWAKISPDVDTNYLFIDLSEKTAEQVIAYAKLGGFKYVLIPLSSWASSRGSYPINRDNFPKGEESLKTTIDKFHAAGLKVGMHMLTSLVSKNDPLVRPIPDPRLLKDASTTLAHDIDAGETSFDAEDPTHSFSANQDHVAGHLKPRIDIQIDEEIISCYVPGKSDSPFFLECRRGACGTLKKSHKAGASIHRLVQRYGSYMADLKKTLKDQIADRIAEVVNQCGFDMIYFDGGELNRANGPRWYYIGQQQTAIWKRLKRDVLFQGSGITHWLWHVIARETCDDHVAIAVKAYMDYHKLKNLQHYKENFMPAELGWCGLLAGGPDHPATTVEDIEHYGARMIAYDAPISIQTSLKNLKNNPQTLKILERLKIIDELRRSGKLSTSQREQLKTGNWSLFDKTGNVAIKPIKDASAKHAGEFPQTYLKSRKDQLLFQGEKSLDYPVSKDRAFKPGALICSVYFTDKVATDADCRNPLNPANAISHITFKDIRGYQGLAVTISVKGSKKDLLPPYPVLNIQLEDDRMRYRDYYIDLDFIGEKRIIISQNNAERLLPEFGKPEYKIKRALRYFHYKKVTAMNLRWMRGPENPGTIIFLQKIEAVSAQKDDRHLGENDR